MNMFFVLRIFLQHLDSRHLFYLNQTKDLHQPSQGHGLPLNHSNNKALKIWIK